MTYDYDKWGGDMVKRSFWLLISVLAVLLLLEACVDPIAVPTPTQMPAPTLTPAPASKSTPTSTPRPEPDSPFGITMSGPVPPNLMGHVKDLGARWMRVDMRWQVIEQTEGSYNWWPTDMLVDQAQSTDVEMVVILTGYAPGAFSPVKPLYFSSSPEAKLRGYENFLREMTRRYRGKIHYWQIENEVTLKNFWGASLDDYLTVLKTAYTAIKGEDPESRVLLAGFATDAVLPLEQVQLLLEQGRGYFDILDVHIYKPAETTDTTTMDTTIAFFYEQMRRAGYKRPVWITETGAPYPCIYRSTTEPPPEVQASEVVKRYAAALSAGAARVFWFYLGGSIPPDELVWKCIQPQQHGMQNFRHMALVRNGERRLAFTTYQVMVSKLEGFTSVSRLDLGKGVFAYRFKKPSGDVFVLWADRDMVVTLPVGTTTVKVISIYGKTLEMEAAQLPLANLPIFVEGLP